MLGSDFELFMKDAVTEEFVPEFFLGLPDKQDKPVPLFDDAGQKVGYIHRDNVSVELCSLPADTNTFADSVGNALDAGQKWLGANFPGLLLGSSTTVSIDKDMQQHPNAKELGCDIDYVSDSVAQASKARDALYAGLLADKRFAGGHVHVSYNYEMFPAWIAAMMCDLFLGMPMRDTLDPERANFYGNLSLHRTTRYPDGSGGVEYRPLDSGWVHSAETRSMVANGAAVVESVMNLGSNDLIAQLMRIRKLLPEKGMIVDVSSATAQEVHEEALSIAVPASGVAQ